MDANARRAKLLLLALAAVGALLFYMTPPKIGDIVEYWAAGRLNLQGHNPYDPVKMLELERSAGYSRSWPVMMVNPPHVLTLAMPFGALPFETAARLWRVLNAAILIGSCSILWKLAGGSTMLVGTFYLVALTFFPSLVALTVGQTSILGLLGLALLLWFDDRDHMIGFGAAIALLLVKPHVVYLVGAAFAIWWLQVRDRKVLLGLGLAGIVFLIALSWNPHFYNHYLQMRRMECLAQFTQSSPGMFIRLATSRWTEFGLQFLPLVLGFAYLFTRLPRRRGSEWNWEREMPALMTISVATAAYSWVFDQVVLLVAAVPLFAQVIQAGTAQLIVLVALWLSLGGVVLLLAGQGVNALWYFWIPWVFLPLLPSLSRGPQGAGQQG